MHLNIAEIREYTGTDDDFIVKLFDKFLAHIRNDISNLKLNTEAKNWESVKKISHSLLSSARIFGLKEISVIHEKIEIDCSSNHPDNIPGMVAEISKLYDEVVSEMNDLKIKLRESSSS